MIKARKKNKKEEEAAPAPAAVIKFTILHAKVFCAISAKNEYLLDI